MTARITVVIPVGPEAHHKQYLEEACLSIQQQTVLPDQVLFVSDMADFEIPHRLLADVMTYERWESPWRMGVSGAFNAGISLAQNELVFMLGADDKLLPNCLERCAHAYEENKEQDAFYWVGVEYSDGRQQSLPCGTAMVTKGLWKLTGGFPPEVGSGACDTAFISMLMVHHPERLVCVEGQQPLAWYRVGEETDTSTRAPWQGVILETRDILTRTWKAPQWGRYT